MKRCLIFFSLFVALSCQAQKNHTDVNADYRNPESRAGIAASLGAESRAERLLPEKIVASLNLQPGMKIADIGTGVGFMLPYLAKPIEPNGKIIAQDIFPDFLERARKRAVEHGVKNVEFVAGKETDPKLPPASVDLALSVDSYHHFNHPGPMLEGIKRGLRPGGRFVVVDYYKNEEAMPGGRALTHIRANKPEVIQEIQAHGFRLVKDHEHIPNKQYLLIFEPAD
jgi:ubiquinone/menaquinone biosynthesis C-methylase UbiE